MKNPKFEIFKSPYNSQFYFRLRAGNDEIILASEGYVFKDSCKEGIDSVKSHAPYDQYYERKDGTSNFTFNLKASNGEIIGRSENYVSRQGRESGIAAVKKDAPHAPTEDLS